MNNILVLLINFAVIYFGNMLAPEHVIINSWKDAALAALLIFLIQLIGIAIINLILVPLIAGAGVASYRNAITFMILSIIIAIIGSVGVSVGAVILADKILDNFAITSTTAYIIVIILISVLSASDSSTKVSNKSNN